jgi:sulfotransferase
VWIRSDYLAGEIDEAGDTSFLMRSYKPLREAYYGQYRNHLLFIEYDDLTRDPKQTMQKIYNFIDEPYYDHDFDNVAFSNDEYDEDMQISNMHTVRKKVEYKRPDIILPPDIVRKYSTNFEFWRGSPL